MGTLFIVSTPIGNLEDITVRAIKTLFSVDVILCEDTRRTGLLLQELQKRYSSTIQGTEVKRPKLLSYYDQVEANRVPEVIALLQDNQNVALVSDAGTPIIADPGFKLVNEAIKRKIIVVSIPGPSAMLAALTNSGLPPNRFLFLGYPPEKQGSRLKLFASLPKDTTIIFYCAPHKLEQTLADMKEVLGDIEIVIARELTKIHEEIWRGKISETQNHFENAKGEIVLLFTK